MTAYTFDLPRSFDPLEFLSGRLTLRADDARWLISTILRKTAHRDTDIWSCVRLDSRILRRVMGRQSNDIIRALERGAIESAPYCPNVKAKGYRLARRYLGDRCVRMPCTNPLLLDRIAREHKRMQAVAEEARSRWLPIHHALDAEQRRLSIEPEADAILDTLPEHTRLCQHVLVGRLRCREYPFTLSSTNRVFNAITGLKRELRRALRIGDEPVGGVDIACAQPALLALAMTRETPSNGPKGCATYKHTSPDSPCLVPASVPAVAPSGSGDVSRFRALVLDGSLYEVLAQQVGLSRDVLKRRVLVDVLAKRGRYPSAVEQAFQKAFPSVYAYIREVNRDDAAELIRRLQRLESWLVVEQVAPRLIGRTPVVTLHDAVYSRRSGLDAVEQAFQEVFAEIGFRLCLKREAAEGGAVDKLTEAG